MDKNDLSDIVTAHLRQDSLVEVVLSVGSEKVSLRGKSIRVLDITIPDVVLLTKDSTPQHTIIEETALPDFEKAAQNLIKTGEPFFTQLRRGWCLPAFLWQKI